MLEQLLLRIAGRAQTQPVGVTAPDRALSSASSGTGTDLGALNFPVRRKNLHALPQALCDKDTRWALSVQAYLTASKPAPQLPSVFDGFGPAHAALAALVWTEQANPPQNQVHVDCAAGWLAAIDPVSHKVWIHPQPPACAAHELTWRVMLVATPPEQLAHCTTTSVAHLLWYYGQAVPSAVQVLPQRIAQHSLALRRFPPVDSRALEMRHLALLRLFSAGALTFAQLHANTSGADRRYLCADIASLFFTGAVATVAQGG
jgi:hypothetical protein